MRVMISPKLFKFKLLLNNNSNDYFSYNSKSHAVLSVSKNIFNVYNCEIHKATAWSNEQQVALLPANVYCKIV